MQLRALDTVHYVQCRCVQCTLVAWKASIDIPRVSGSRGAGCSAAQCRVGLSQTRMERPLLEAMPEAHQPPLMPLCQASPGRPLASRPQSAKRPLSPAEGMSGHSGCQPKRKVNIAVPQCQPADGSGCLHVCQTKPPATSLCESSAGRKLAVSRTGEMDPPQKCVKVGGNLFWHHNRVKPEVYFLYRRQTSLKGSLGKNAHISLLKKVCCASCRHRPFPM